MKARRCYDVGVAAYLYVVSTLRLAAASSAGGIQMGKHVPETHLVHSNSPGSTRILVFPSSWRPDRVKHKREPVEGGDKTSLHLTLSCHFVLLNTSSQET